MTLKGGARSDALISIEGTRLVFLLSGIIIALLITFGNVSASCSCSQSHDQALTQLDQSYGENRDSADLASDTHRQTRAVRSERQPRIINPGTQNSQQVVNRSQQVQNQQSSQIVAFIDKKLLDKIDELEPLYFNDKWNVNHDQYKAWIATIAWGEGFY